MAFGTTPSEGTEYALFNTTNRKIKNALWNSRARRYYGSVPAGVIAAGAQVKLVRLEVGQVVTGGLLTWAALGASTQFWVGDDGDCDRYKTTTNGAVASINQAVTVLGNQGGDCRQFNNPAGVGYEITSTTQDVILTNSYAAATGTLTAGDIKVVIDVSGE